MSDLTLPPQPGETLPCPICKKAVTLPARGSAPSERGTFPFCSERCKLVDLGRWLSGSYQIPVKETADDAMTDEPRSI